MSVIRQFADRILRAVHRRGDRQLEALCRLAWDAAGGDERAKQQAVIAALVERGCPVDHEKTVAAVQRGEVDTIFSDYGVLFRQGDSFIRGLEQQLAADRANGWLRASDDDLRAADGLPTRSDAEIDADPMRLRDTSPTVFTGQWVMLSSSQPWNTPWSRWSREERRNRRLAERFVAQMQRKGAVRKSALPYELRLAQLASAEDAEALVAAKGGITLVAIEERPVPAVAAEMLRGYRVVAPRESAPNTSYSGGVVYCRRGVFASGFVPVNHS